MKAAVRYRYGTPDVVELADVERPTPTDDQVLVRVRAASVNRADLDCLDAATVVRPRCSSAFADRGSRGWDSMSRASSSRLVRASRRFDPGDEVFADMYPYSGQGAFAEYVCAPERAFASMPAGMSFEEAATLPHSAILAVQGLRRATADDQAGRQGPHRWRIRQRRPVRGPDRQVARRGGDRRLRAPDKLEFVRSLGADHVIDYKQVDYTTAGERYDWIVDTDSHHSVLRVRRALKPEGVYVTLGGTTPAILGALTVGPVVDVGNEPVDRPAAVVEAVRPR